MLKLNVRVYLRLLATICVLVPQSLVADPSLDSYHDFIRRVREQADRMYPDGSLKRRYSALREDSQFWENPTVNTYVGPMVENGTQGTQLTTSVLQPIPLYGRRALNAQALKAREVSESISLIQRSLEFEHTVIGSVYARWVIEEELTFLKQRLKSIQPIQQHLSAIPVLSARRQTEKLLIEHKIELMQQRIGVLTDQRRTQEEMFKLLMPEEQDVYSPPPPSLGSLNRLLPLAMQLLDRSALDEQRNQAEVRALDRELEVIKTRAKPDVRLALSTQSQRADSNQDVFLFGIDVTLPFLNSGSQQRIAKEQEILDTKQRFKQEQQLKRAEKMSLLNELQNAHTLVQRFSPAYRGERAGELAVARRALLNNELDVRLFLELEDDVASINTQWRDAVHRVLAAWSSLALLSGEHFQVNTGELAASSLIDGEGVLE